MAHLKDYLSPLLRGVKANLVPGLCLQAFAASLVISYYFVAPIRGAMSNVGALKESLGLGFSIPSTLVFGALIPYSILFIMGRLPKGRRLGELFFHIVFWTWRGAEVDGFYRLQSLLFGAEPSLRVIVPKVLLDQLIYNPFWVVPVQTFLFLWKDSGYSKGEVRRRLKENSFFERCLMGLATTWFVWVPGVIIVYSLPSALQLPICNVITCFWCLLLTFVSVDAPAKSTREA